MEQLKVRKKDPVVVNTIVFLVLSYLFLYLQYAYRHQLSPVSVVYLRKSLELFWYVAIPMVVAGALIWRIHELGKWAYGFAVLMVSFKVVEGLFIEFNKIIVVALFFYTIISYFLYQLLGEYWKIASINPNYRQVDLFSPLLRNIRCQVGEEGSTVSGVLTNWDDDGCFLKLEKPWKAEKSVRVLVQFGGREFLQQGELVAHTHDFTGIGIRFQVTRKTLNVFNWSEFIELIQELGFDPERLR